MKIAILGAGAMGSLFGARLAEAGAAVSLIDVNAAHIDAINEAGLHLEADDGDRHIAVPAGRADDFSEPVDLLVVFTKAPYTAQALESVAHLVAEKTWGLTLQNGLGTGERLQRLLPQERILVGVTNWPSTLVGPGHIRSFGEGWVHLWSLLGQPSAAVTELVSLLSAAKLNCEADENVVAAIWEKVAFNSVMNAIASVSGLTVGGMADSPSIQALAATVVNEVFATARAAQVAINEQRVHETLADAFAGHRAHKPSMLQDVLAGRPTEIDVINGAIVDKARTLSVPVPANQALVQVIRGIEGR